LTRSTEALSLQFADGFEGHFFVGGVRHC
jgi:hypothetical protein